METLEEIANEIAVEIAEQINDRYPDIGRLEKILIRFAKEIKRQAIEPL